MIAVGATLRWFVSPRFADAERTRVAHLLNILLLSALLFLCVVFSIRVALLGLVGHWFVYPIFVGLAAGLLVTLRRGYVHTATQGPSSPFPVRTTGV